MYREWFDMSSTLFAALLLSVLSSSYAYSSCNRKGPSRAVCCCSVPNHKAYSANVSCGVNGGLDAFLLPKATRCRIQWNPKGDNNSNDNVPPGTGKRIEYPSAWRDRKLGHGYEHVPELGSSYKFHTIPETWDNARRECEKEGAHLAIVNSERESAHLKDMYKRVPYIPNARYNDFAYLGYHDLYEEGTFLTIFGEPLSKTGFSRLWANNDNAGGCIVHPGEDCGSIYRHSGGLNDLDCDYKYAFFCEREDEEYPPRTEINYAAGAYEGVEMERKPPTGTVLRTQAAPGYEHFPGVGFYRFHTTPTTWENARRICKAEGGHLAIINSISEHQVLLDLYKRYPVVHYVQYNNYAYIGFHDQYQEGNYVTIYDEPLTTVGFYQWAPGEPNNLWGSSIHAGEDCGSLHRHGGLNDLPCNMINAFICEQELYE